MENVTPTSPAVTLGPPAEASSPPGVSPGPQTFPMSPSAKVKIIQVWYLVHLWFPLWRMHLF